jgi:hypothetical protein
MAVTSFSSRVLYFGYGTAVAFGVRALPPAGAVGPAQALVSTGAQSQGGSGPV